MGEFFLRLREREAEAEREGRKPRQRFMENEGRPRRVLISGPFLIQQVSAYQG